jgi:hypothetical protein
MREGTAPRYPDLDLPHLRAMAIFSTISGITSPLVIPFRYLSISRPPEREKGIFTIFPEARIRFREYKGEVHELEKCEDFLLYIRPLVVDDSYRLSPEKQVPFLEDCLEEATAISSWPREARHLYRVYDDILKKVVELIKEELSKRKMSVEVQALQDRERPNALREASLADEASIDNVEDPFRLRARPDILDSIMDSLRDYVHKDDVELFRCLFLGERITRKIRWMSRQAALLILIDSMKGKNGASIPGDKWKWACKYFQHWNRTTQQFNELNQERLSSVRQQHSKNISKDSEIIQAAFKML